MNVWLFLGLAVASYVILCVLLFVAANEVDKEARRRNRRRGSVAPDTTDNSANQWASHIDEHERAFIETDSIDERDFMDRAGLNAPRKPERAS